MIVELGAGSSQFAIGAAALVLAAHITAGGVGILSGALALAAPKGGRLHRRAGTWFFASMLAMSALGAGAAALLPDRVSVVAGLLTFYLVATGWASVQRGARVQRGVALGGVLLAMCIAVAGVGFGALAAAGADGQLDGQSAAPAFVFATLALLGAVGDMRTLRAGGLSGAPRIARHLWRMCTALLIAALSLFLGQQRLFPPALRGSFLLLLPELAILASMAYWLLRGRSTRSRSRAPRP